MAREIIGPFLFGVIAFTTIFAGGNIIPGLLKEASKYNLDFNKVMALFFLRMPAIISLTFAMSALLAALLSFNRLSGDSEITAFRAGGLSIVKLTIAPLIFGFIISLFSIFINETVVPKASFLEENTILQIKDMSKAEPQVKQNVNIPKYENGYLKRLIYSHEMVGSIMKDVSVSEYDKGRLSRIVFADEAEWLSGDGWEFRNGTMHQFGVSRQKAYVIDFEKEVIAVDVNPRDVSGRQRDPDQLSLTELGTYINQQVSYGSDVTELRIKWHQKLAIPFSCLIFVLLGAPMGIKPQRSSSSVGLGLSIIVIFFYYVLLSAGMWFGLMRVFPPLLAAWLPNLLIGSYGVYLLKQKSNS